VVADRRILYYITDRKAFPGDEDARRRCLLDKIGETCRAGVDYVQLREKDLSAREIEALAREAMRVMRQQSSLKPDNGRQGTVLLINSRTDVTIAANGGGVHLTAEDVSPPDVRNVWNLARGRAVAGYETLAEGVRISISCHSVQEVMQAAASGADLALLAPIFEKRDVLDARSLGLEALRQAARAKIPVLALGGVTLQNAEYCLQAGAAGVAAIRLFQENDVAGVVRALRSM
jgi:thiamine-phosphate pyrophosphorylase